MGNQYKSMDYALIITGALVASQSVKWFIAGKSENHSQARNIAVAIQLLVGVGIVVYAWYKHKRREKSDGSHHLNN